MKKCPFCAEDIQDDAIKCKHCGEFLNKQSAARWYFRPPLLVVLFLCVGPFMLPLIWFNPHLTSQKKIIFTGVILVLSYFLFLISVQALKSIREYYDLIGSQIGI